MLPPPMPLEPRASFIFRESTSRGGARTCCYFERGGKGEEFILYLFGFPAQGLAGFACRCNVRVVDRQASFSALKPAIYLSLSVSKVIYISHSA